MRVGVERTLHDLAQAQTTKNTHSNVHCFQQVGSFTIPQTLCTYCSFPKTGASCRKWVGGWTFMYAIVSQSACACVYARMHRISHVMYNVHMYASMILSIYLSVSFSPLSLSIYIALVDPASRPSCWRVFAVSGDNDKQVVCSFTIAGGMTPVG